MGSKSVTESELNHSIPIWMLIFKLLIQTYMCLFNRSHVNRPLPTYWLVHWHSLAFTRAPSRTRSQKAAQLLQYFTDHTRGELDQLGYIRRVGYRFAPQCFCLIFATSFNSVYELTLTMLRSWSYKLRFYWFFICASVQNTFAFSWHFLRFHSVAVSVIAFLFAVQIFLAQNRVKWSEMFWQIVPVSDGTSYNPPLWNHFMLLDCN